MKTFEEFLEEGKVGRAAIAILALKAGVNPEHVAGAPGDPNDERLWRDPHTAKEPRRLAARRKAGLKVPTRSQ